MKAVFFDLDETLFDHRYASRMGLAALQQKYPELRPIPTCDLETEFWDILNTKHHEIMAGKITPHQGRLQRLTELYRRCRMSFDPDSLESDARLYRETYQLHRRAIPGMASVLHHCKAKALIVAVVTNNFHVEQIEKLHTCQIFDQIDHLVSSEHAGVAKPDPAIFHQTLQQCGVTASETVMVGDSWISDIIGARAAGLRAIWFNRRNALCPDPALATEITTAEELLPLLA